MDTRCRDPSIAHICLAKKILRRPAGNVRADAEVWSCQVLRISRSAFRSRVAQLHGVINNILAVGAEQSRCDLLKSISGWLGSDAPRLITLASRPYCHIPVRLEAGKIVYVEAVQCNG